MSFRTGAKCAIVAAGLAIAAAHGARADVYAYTYTGNNFDTFLLTSPQAPTSSDHITFTLEFSQKLLPNSIYRGNLAGIQDAIDLAPIAWFYSDGVNSFSSNTPLVQLQYRVFTDSNGSIYNSLPASAISDEIFGFQGANRIFHIFKRS